MDVSTVGNSLNKLQTTDVNVSPIKEYQDNLVNKSVNSINEQEQNNTRQKFGIEALKQSVQNDPIAQFVSYLV